MKKTILFALIWVAAMACDQKESAAPQPELQSTNLSYRHAISIPASGSDLKVELKGVADNRCPMNANCISMGSAKLVFTVSDASNQVDVNLEFRGDSKTNTQTFKLSGVEYVLSVSEVLPYPETSQSPKLEDYKINVTIEKK